MSKRTSRILSLLLACVLLITPAAVLANDSIATIEGTVFLDDNQNGIIDGSEGGIFGVTVDLYAVGGMDPLASDTTDDNGNFTFTVQALGDYIVKETDLESHASTTPNEVEVTIENPGNVIDEIDFGDFKPEPGETTRIDFLIMDFFDLLLVDVLDLRNLGGWGYGNIARVYFLAMLSAEHDVSDIIAMRDSMGWGEIMTVLGRAGLKGYNLGLVVSGRDAPSPIQNLMDGCSLITEPEQVQELFSLGGNNGSIKKACKLAQEVGGDFDKLVKALGLLADHNQKQVREMLQSEAMVQVNQDNGGNNQDNGNNGNNGNHGPPACKGKNKNDEGCSKK